MKKKIFQNINFKISNTLPKGSIIILGISGGSDSIALLNMIKNLKNDYQIIACHMNHMIRNSKSDADEMFVKKICKEANVKLIVKKVNIPNLSKIEKFGLEEISRIKRREFFEYNFKKFNAKKIVLAHHLDDQVETFLMRLSRGTSLTGLESIKENDGRYFRPMLDVSKDEILEYAQINNLEWREDETNKDNLFTRNFIRNKIIPLFKELNPKFNNSVNNIINIIKETNTYIDKNIEVFLKKNISIENNIIILNLLSFSGKPKAFIFSVIAMVLKKFFSLNQNLIYKNMEDTHALITKKGPSGQVNIKNNIVIEKGYSKLFFYNLKKIPNKDFFYKTKELKSSSFDFFKLHITKDINKKGYSYFTIKNTDNILIRSFKKGDRISYSKNKKTKKLQDIYINEKIPKLARNYIPLLILNNDIIKIPFVDAKTSSESISKYDLIGIKITSKLIEKMIK